MCVWWWVGLWGSGERSETGMIHNISDALTPDDLLDSGLVTQSPFIPPAAPQTTLSLQIEFLEVRLAEVMAYADIPPSMRPALSEFDPVALITGDSPLNGTSLNSIHAARLQAVKTALIKAMAQLREMNKNLGEGREGRGGGRGPAPGC